MSGKLKQSDYKEIESLTNRIIWSDTKKDAANPLRRLKFLANTLDVQRNISYMITELIGCAESASGRVQQKDHWISHTKTALYKLNAYVEREESVHD